MCIAALFKVPQSGSNLNAHQLMNGLTEYDISIQWDILQP